MVINNSIQQTLSKVLRTITPDLEEKYETISFAEELIKRLNRELGKEKIEAEVKIEGSVAKDTWLAKEKDIDIFILIPKKYGTTIFPKILNVAKKICGTNWMESYAEHPYLQANINNYKIDFVPCFKVRNALEIISSVDRTPLHTSYLNKHLTEQSRSEIRLLKRFMKGLGVYGAEIRIGGFSGYLCELLIVYYGCFINLLKMASSWREVEIIDIEDHFKGKYDKVKELFHGPFIVIDPIDNKRNVAAPVRTEKRCTFIAASREFLKNPKISFFYPKQISALTIDTLKQRIDSRGSDLIFVKTSAIDAAPDVVWGQLLKSRKILSGIITRHGFKLLRNEVWTNIEQVIVFLFELCHHSMPTIEKHLGPPIINREDSERFLEIHLSSNQTISGPRIEDFRWVVDRKRKYVDVKKLLKNILKDGGRKVGIPKQMSISFLSSLEILLGDEIEKIYLDNRDFAIFLTNYLIGMPIWLYDTFER